MKLRATVFSRTEDWVCVRFEFSDDERSFWNILGIRPQVYTSEEWSFFLGLLVLGGRKADVEIIERVV